MSPDVDVGGVGGCQNVMSPDVDVGGVGGLSERNVPRC